MNVRTLVNVAYAALAESRDEDGLAKLDATLEQANLAAEVAMAKRWRRRAVPAAANPLTEADLIAIRAKRLLRSVPDQSRNLAAQMAQLSRSPGAAR